MELVKVMTLCNQYVQKPLQNSAIVSPLRFPRMSHLPCHPETSVSTFPSNKYTSHADKYHDCSPCQHALELSQARTHSHSIHSLQTNPHPDAKRIELTSVVYAMIPNTVGTATTYTNVNQAVRGVQRKYLCRLTYMSSASHHVSILVSVRRSWGRSGIGWCGKSASAFRREERMRIAGSVLAYLTSAGSMARSVFESANYPLRMIKGAVLLL